MKKKYQEYEYSNTRFIEFMKNEEEKPPLPEYDENGIRICSAIPESKIGDIVMRENKLSTIVLLQHLCKGIADIISFFTNAQSNRQEQPFLRTEILPQSFQQPSSFPQIQQIEFTLPFTEHFILLVYRYLIGIIECGELLTVDDTRTKEQVFSFSFNFIIDTKISTLLCRSLNISSKLCKTTSNSCYNFKDLFCNEKE